MVALADAFWGVGFGLIMLLNYPIPAQAHHLDKFLAGLLVAVAWSGWFLASPQSLGRALDGRLVRWVNVALMNLVVFCWWARLRSG